MHGFSETAVAQTDEIFQPKDTVRVLHGQFADFLMQVDQVGCQKRAFASIHLLGWQTCIAADHQTLSKVN